MSPTTTVVVVVLRSKQNDNSVLLWLLSWWWWWQDWQDKKNFLCLNVSCRGCYCLLLFFRQLLPLLFNFSLSSPLRVHNKLIGHWYNLTHIESVKRKKDKQSCLLCDQKISLNINISRSRCLFVCLLYVIQIDNIFSLLLLLLHIFVYSFAQKRGKVSIKSI